MKPGTKSSLSPLNRLDGLLALLSFASGLALYVSTLAPGLLTDDSAEFQTLAYTLGMTHPTGYPVYLLMAKLFTILVPLSDIAYRVNLLSAVFGALAIALVYLAGRMLTGWRLAALTGALSLGTIGLFWSQAVIAELYTAAAACIAAEFVLLLCWRQSRKWQFLFTAGLLGGLSLGIHSTVALMAPAILLYMLLTTRRRVDWLGAVSGAALGIALALASFLILDAMNTPSSYFNSVARPSLSVWGLTADEFNSPFERLSFLYTAYQFRRFMFSQSGVVLPTAQMYFEGTDWPTLVLLMLGLVHLFIRNWKDALLVLLSWICQMTFVLNYAIWDIHVFFVPTFVALIIICLAGVAAFQDGAAWLVKRLGAESWKTLGSNLTAGLLAILLFAPSIPVVKQSLQVGYPVILEELGDGPYQASAPEMPRRLALAIVNAIEDNAIVFTNWGQLYDLYYVAHMEQGRTGMAFHETFPQDGVTELAPSAREYIDANLGKRPIYTTEHSIELLRYYRLIKVDSWLELYRFEPRL